jgi:glycosyltransferase involved in cell wall biosynthesis
MPEPTRRVLLVCHVAAAQAAATAAAVIWGAHADIDVLCYGRASEDFPAPAGARLVESPLQAKVAPMKAARIIARLRRHRYEIVALSQPGLGLSRARALLLAFALLVGSRRAIVLDTGAGRIVRPITVGLVTVDILRWIVLQAFSQASATIGALALARFSRSVRPPRGPNGFDGSVLYLRTDIELRITPLRAGGSLAHTEGILTALRNRGHEVSFWSTGEVDGIPESVREARLPALLKGNLSTEIAELLSGLIQGLVPPKGFRPAGFIYQRYSLNNLAGVILSRRWKLPLILEANDSEAKWRQDFSVLRYPRLAYACERLILRRAEIVSAVSDNAAEDLRAAGALGERLRIVPNGVTVARFVDATPMPLSSLGGSFVICFVGLFYPWHGVRYLAEAFALWHQRRPDVRLLLVGDGEEAPVVRSLLERGGALEATHFAGLVSRQEAPRYMAAADVLVSPHANIDHFIGSPIKLFEYMAAGRPIVATRVGQIQEVLRDGETGLLVEPEDPEAMAAALDRLYSDRDLRRRLGEAARSEAEQRHSWDARLEAVLGGVGTAAGPAGEGGT